MEIPKTSFILINRAVILYACASVIGSFHHHRRRRCCHRHFFLLLYFANHFFSFLSLSLNHYSEIINFFLSLSLSHVVDATVNLLLLPFFWHFNRAPFFFLSLLLEQETAISSFYEFGFRR